MYTVIGSWRDGVMENVNGGCPLWVSDDAFGA
jgi:hypothetical protein